MWGLCERDGYAVVVAVRMKDPRLLPRRALSCLSRGWASEQIRFNLGLYLWDSGTADRMSRGRAVTKDALKWISDEYYGAFPRIWQRLLP